MLSRGPSHDLFYDGVSCVPTLWGEKIMKLISVTHFEKTLKNKLHYTQFIYEDNVTVLGIRIRIRRIRMIFGLPVQDPRIH